MSAKHFLHLVLPSALLGAAMTVGLLHWPPKTVAAPQKPTDPAPARNGSPTAPDLTPALRAMELRLAALEGRNANQNREPMEQAQHDDSAGRAAAPPSTPEEVRQQLDDIVRSEPRDPSWASGYERQLREAATGAFSSPDQGSVKSVACASSMCRIELTHRSDTSRDEYRNRLRLAVPDVTFRVARDDTDGEHGTIIHVARPGYDWPM